MMKLYRNNEPFDFQKYFKNRFVLESLFRMQDNFIVPLISDEFATTLGISVSSQKLYKYDEFHLSRYAASMDITEIRTEISDLTLNFSLQTLGSYQRWYTPGDNVTNIANGYYSIEMIDITI